MSRLYRDSHRALQRQYDTERLADRLEQRLCRQELTDDDRAFVERLDMFFLATVDDRGQPSCSYKGGDPGVLRVLDRKTIAFPVYDGNGMFLSAGNVNATGRVGLLLIDFENPKRLRINGTAKLEPADYVSPGWPEAQFTIVVSISEIFPNCPRYVHKREVIEASRFVPRAGMETPVPAWKQMDWACDVLPAGDPASKPKAGS
jgi:predicted pyridoxine 5'-phosphate oxidase superfamily flavin-nucleotide-binding protein